MPRADGRPGGDRVGQRDGEVRAAVRFAGWATAAACGFLLVAAVWVSTCPRAEADTVACGAPQRFLLAVGGPAIAFGAALWALLRTYRVWKAAGTWWGWQGAGWFLLTVAVLMVALSLAPIAGPALFL